MRWLWHFLFGCNRDIDVGHGTGGRVVRCSTCLQAWLVSYDGKHKRPIAQSQAMDYSEYFDG